MQSKEAFAYGVYACTNTFLPTAVAALVLFYGGNLVLQGQMSAGALVSFMLYQQSLASAFQVHLCWRQPCLVFLLLLLSCAASCAVLSFLDAICGCICNNLQCQIVHVVSQSDHC